MICKIHTNEGATDSGVEYPQVENVQLASLIMFLF